MEPNLGEMAIAESRLAESDFRSSIGGLDEQGGPPPAPAGLMDIDIDGEPMVDEDGEIGGEKGPEGEEASMRVDVEDRVDESIVATQLDSSPGIEFHHSPFGQASAVSLPAFPQGAESSRIDVPASLQIPASSITQPMGMTGEGDPAPFNARVTEVAPQTSYMRATAQPDSSPLGMPADADIEMSIPSRPIPQTDAQVDQADIDMRRSAERTVPGVPVQRQQPANADANADPLSEIAEMIQEAERHKVPAAAGSATTTVAVSSMTVVVTETTVESVAVASVSGADTDMAQVSDAGVQSPDIDSSATPIPQRESQVEDISTRQLAAPVSSERLSESSVPPVRRPGPTPSSLAALSVSPFTSAAKDLESAQPKSVSPLPTTIVSPEAQSATSQPPWVPNSAQSLNIASAQVSSFTASGAEPSTSALPQLSSGTSIPTEFADGETDDADGETDHGEDLAHHPDSGAEEEFMNGATKAAKLNPGDPGYTETLYQTSGRGRGGARGRGTAATRGTSSRGTGTRGRAAASGPRRMVVEVVLQKYKRGKFKPTANDDVASMLRAPLGLGADDPVDPDLAFAPAGQVRAANASAPHSRSASILPPPPPVIDPSLLGETNGDDVPAEAMTPGAQKQKSDRRHWDYISDEGEHPAQGSLAPPAGPVKQPRKRATKVARPRAVAPAEREKESMAGQVAGNADTNTADPPSAAGVQSAQALPTIQPTLAQIPAENGTAANLESTVTAAPAVSNTPDLALAASGLPADASMPDVSGVPDDLFSGDVQMTSAEGPELPVVGAIATTETGPSEPTVTATSGLNAEKEQPASTAPGATEASAVDSAALTTSAVNGTASTRAKPRKRPKKAERELNEALLSLASSVDNDDENGDAAPAPTQPAEGDAQEAAATEKPRKKPKKKTQPDTAAEPSQPAAEEPPAPEQEPEPVVPVLAPRRKLKMEQTWFNPDELPTAVPYPIRYYLSDGQPIVSWREPEEVGAHSNRPEGTLYGNGCRVNPAGSVDSPEDRRANTACKFCRFSIAKCDGYGDRPCSTCCKSKRPVCLYNPWTVEEMEEYEGDLEAGYKRKQADEAANGRDTRRLKRDPPPADLDMTAEDEATTASMLMADPAELLPAQTEIPEAAPVEIKKSHKAKRPKMKSRILAPASSPVPDPADGVADMLEVVIEIPDAVGEQEADKPSKPKRAKTAKRKKIEEQAAPVVPAEPEPAPKPAVADGTIRRRRMQKQQDWFDSDALPVSVPEPIRYYLDAKDGQPIVSWREPESAGEKSDLPAGTLFANGNMVNAEGFVNVPADRRANHACEACRSSLTKCDGYGDRPCSTCIRLRKPTCSYKPWSEAEQREHQAALEYGTLSRRREVHGDSQRFRKHFPALDEVDLTERDQAIVQSMLTGYLPEPEALTKKTSVSAAKKRSRVSPPQDMEVEVEIDLPLASLEREDEDLPMYDAPWPSLHDAEASQLADEPVPNAQEPIPVDVESQPEQTSLRVAPRKRKIARTLDAGQESGRSDHASQPYKKKKLTRTEQEPIDAHVCFEGLKLVRTLKKQQDWFDPDELAVSVPYTIRYYLMPEDGTPVVSSAAPEKPGRKSKRPEGTLYEDGSMVNPNGKVDPPATRRANHACEMCRFSATKCDGYGDRPCSACMKHRKPVCVYEPWTDADQAEYQRDLETGISSSVESSSRGSRRNVQLPAELLTTKHDQALLRSMLLDEDIEKVVDLKSDEDEQVEADIPAARSSRRKRIITPEPEPKPSRKTKSAVAETLAESPEKQSGRQSVSFPPKLKESQRRDRLPKKKRTAAEQEPIDVDTCFAGLVPRRRLKLQHDWFDPDALPVSVPYTMRYYVMPRDGQTVVSSAPPEEAGVKSKQPEGTLYENGNRVGPRGSVDAPVTRMAKQPCECCRFSLQKCDGYGDRSCSTCTRLRKPVCVYEPCTDEEHAQYLHDLEHGRRRREKVDPPADLQTIKQDRAVLEAMLADDDAVPDRRSQRTKAEEVQTSQRFGRAKASRGTSLAVSEDALDIIDIDVDEDSEPEPPKPSKRKKSKSVHSRRMPRRQFDRETSSHSNDALDDDNDPGNLYIGPVPRRHLHMPQEDFYVEDLPVTVPYPIRYYMTDDGYPIVSWRKPELEGSRSKRLVGTLYENGNRVSPRQTVDTPADRRANHACEWCRFNLTKCDGFGDRPCTHCCSLGRPVCVYRPWSVEDMRNYLIDIGEGPDDAPAEARRAFNVSKALTDLGTSMRDEIVIQSMLEAGPADAGTAEYREAMARASNKSRDKRPKARSPTPPEESFGFEVEIPVEESVDTRRESKSKRKPGWLPPRNGTDTAWTAERTEPPVAGPSKQPVSSASSAPVSRSSSSAVKSNRISRNGKAKLPAQDRESEAFTKAGFQVVTEGLRKFKVPSGTRRPRTGGSGTGSDADLSVSGKKRQPDEPVGKARKRRRIVSSTPELDPAASDALYAEMNYPESFERSKLWAPFEEVLGISEDESDESASDIEVYLYEKEQDGRTEWIGLRRTPGMRVEIELESGVEWGAEAETEADDAAEEEDDDHEARGLQLVQAIAHAVVSTSSALQNVGQRAWSAATELAHGLVDADVDDSRVEDLLPSEK